MGEFPVISKETLNLILLNLNSKTYPPKIKEVREHSESDIQTVHQSPAQKKQEEFVIAEINTIVNPVKEKKLNL